MGYLLYIYSTPGCQIYEPRVHKSICVLLLLVVIISVFSSLISIYQYIYVKEEIVFSHREPSIQILIHMNEGRNDKEKATNKRNYSIILQFYDNIKEKDVNELKRSNGKIAYAFT